MKSHLVPFLAVIALAVSAVTSRAADPIPAFTPGARILFQSDSITDGNRGRNADPNHILGNGYAFIIAKKHGAALDRATGRAPAIHWIWYSVHPTCSGHQILAGEWERAECAPCTDARGTIRLAACLPKLIS